MKHIIIPFFLLLIVWSCDPQNGEPTTDSTDSTATEQPQDTPTTTQEEPEVPSITIGQRVDSVTITDSEKDTKEAAGKQDIEIDLGEGYTLTENDIVYTGVEWLSNKMDIRKDGEVIYTWNSEEEEHRLVIRQRTADEEHPRLIKQGEKVIILLDAIVPPNSTFLDAVVISDGTFIKVAKDVPTTNFANEEQVTAFFTTIFTH